MPKVDLENVEEAFAYAAEIREHAPSLFERLESARPEDALEMLTYAEQLQKATTYLRPSARQAVRYALEVAFLAHRGQTRRSGQPFVTHPVAVASILAETRMDRDAVVSGLLHDTVEDTDMTFQEVEAMFGRDVRGIVDAGRFRSGCQVGCRLRGGLPERGGSTRGLAGRLDRLDGRAHGPPPRAGGSACAPVAKVVA